MKLRWAEIKNFRFLKDLYLDFSTSANQPLTVIRAANESGKTTCKNALIWCLYGTNALPDGRNSRLAPNDELGEENETLEISVEIEFELDNSSDLGRGDYRLTRSVYRLTRTCRESIGTNESWRRSGETQQLWRVTAAGTEHVPDNQVTAIIESALPESLKDVYVTDGDRALSFIEAAATQGTKRKRVSGAIESLLGLDIVEKTIKNLGNVSTKFSQEIDNKDYAKELERLNDQISGYEEDTDNWNREFEEAGKRISVVSKALADKESEVDEILKLGDKEELIQRRNSIDKRASQAKGALVDSEKALASVVYNESISKAFLKDHLSAAKEMLDSMSQAKQLPKVNVPILEELLTRETCFCGSDLRGNTEEGIAKRENISNKIEESRESDFIQEAASSLFYRLRSVNLETADEDWVSEYNTVSARHLQLHSTLVELESDREKIEESVAEVDDDQLLRLREQRDKLRQELQKCRNIQATKNTQIEDIKQRWKDAEEERRKVSNRLGKADTSATNWDIAITAKSVFSHVIDILKGEELNEVSREMRRIFLAMIGSGDVQNMMSSIKDARLTKEFDIKVYGYNDRELDPDQDLNGASRRAISLAFILALTKVSKVEAPNIIDTPLGMMSGYVKQSVLLRTIEEGSQIILFLTHDEIRGVEQILDQYAGKIFTLTNPAHYPTMLLHKPQTDEMKVLRCDCSYHQSCEICERKQLRIS